MENLNRSINYQNSRQLYSKIDGKLNSEIDFQVYIQLKNQLERKLHRQLYWELGIGINSQIITQMKDEKS